MISALIGYSGFVGKNLDRQFNFDDRYNSKNIKDIQNKQYDLVVCCGVSASMWLANNFPDRDLANINSLLESIKTIKAKQFILISSIAVFGQNALNIDEDCRDFEENIAYGKNRALVEKFISDNFENNLIVRLPALFGQGLEKNFIYDLQNQEPAFMPKEKFSQILAKLADDDKNFLQKYYHFDSAKEVYVFDKPRSIADNARSTVLESLKKADFTALKFTHSESAFQFYNLDNLWGDINIALENNLSNLHLASSPIKAKEIALRFFDIDFNNDNAQIAFNYDMQTKYAKLWAKEGKYQYSKDDIFKSLERFFQ